MTHDDMNAVRGRIAKLRCWTIDRGVTASEAVFALKKIGELEAKLAALTEPHTSFTDDMYDTAPNACQGNLNRHSPSRSVYTLTGTLRCKYCQAYYDHDRQCWRKS